MKFNVYEKNFNKISNENKYTGIDYKNLMEIYETMNNFTFMEFLVFLGYLETEKSKKINNNNN